MHRPAALIVAVAALAACSSQSAATVVASSTTTAPTGPTTRQFASVVARTQVEMTDLAAKLDGCSFPEGVQALTCSLSVKTAALQGQIAARDLRKVGPPPSEVSSLVADTLKVEDELAAEDVSACEQEESASCAGTLTRVGFTVDRVLKVLAGWQPYSA